MQEQVTILTAEQYFKKYGVDGIGKGADRWMIKRQLIDAFRKEIFGLVAMRTKKLYNSLPPEGDPEASKIAKNVIHDATRKWVKLCKMFAMYKETANLLKEDDLKLYDEIGEIGTTSEELMEKQEAEEENNGGPDEEMGEAETGEAGRQSDAEGTSRDKGAT